MWECKLPSSGSPTEKGSMAKQFGHMHAPFLDDPRVQEFYQHVNETKRDWLAAWNVFYFPIQLRIIIPID